MSTFLSTRALNPESNLLFGAGGAGTYSDGKLYSRIRDPRARAVLEAFVAAGAPQDLLVDARPHVGTDLLHGVVENLCRELLRLGGEIRWRERLVELQVGRKRAARREDRPRERWRRTAWSWRRAAARATALSRFSGPA